MQLKFIAILLTLLMTSCGSLKPLPITRLPVGNVKRLMELPEFDNVKDSSPEVKRWAKEALHTVNDLEFNIRKEDE